MTTPIKSPWALAQLENAIIALRMPSDYTQAGDAIYSTADGNTIEAGLVAANKCIGELTAENERLKNLLTEWVAPMDGIDADKFVSEVAARIKETRQALEGVTADIEQAAFANGREVGERTAEYQG